MNRMITDPKYLANITYTPSLNVFMTQEEAKVRVFRKETPTKDSDKRTKSDFCKEIWYIYQFWFTLVFIHLLRLCRMKNIIESWCLQGCPRRAIQRREIRHGFRADNARRGQG